VIRFRPFILSLILLVAPAAAHTTFMDEGPNRVPPIRIGPVIGITGAVSMVDYKVSDQQREFSVGSLFGIQADFPLNEDISILARLGYYTLSFTDKNSAIDIPTTNGTDLDELFVGTTNPVLKTEGSFKYLSLGTMLKAGYFVVGFQFCLPMAATITNSSDDIAIPLTRNGYTLKQDISPTTDERNFIVEATLGGDFPIVASRTGALRLGVFVSYPLTQSINATGKNLPHLDSNLRLPSVMLQLGYLFSL
jgi:hypothetical protein